MVIFKDIKMDKLETDVKIGEIRIKANENCDSYVDLSDM